MKRYGPIYILFSLLLVIIVSACTAPLTQAPASREWDPEELEQIVDDWRVRSGVPGVVVGLSLPGEEPLLLASGMSDAGNGIYIRVHDTFRIASITKTFIAAETLKLASQGNLRLDDPLETVLPGMPHGNKVTLRHLLGHRSGYFDPVHDEPGFIPHVAENMGRLWTWDEMLSLSFAHDLHFAPGSEYRYGNTNYILLAKVIEQVTGTSPGAALTEDLLLPLSLFNTFYATPEMSPVTTSLVHGYTVHPLSGKTVDTTTLPYETILSVSADTMISNASDLLTWCRALYGNGSSVLEPSMREQMLLFDEISDYGLGVFRSETPLGPSLGHGGDTAGYLSLMEYIPSHDLAFVILINSDDASIHPGGLRDELLAAMYPNAAQDQTGAWIASLQSQDASIRNKAISALGHSGPASEQVIEALIQALESDPVAENRREAALALGLVGRGSAQRALSAALQDPDFSVREAAALALALGLNQ